MMVRGDDWARIRRNTERLGEPLTDKATTWSATAVGGFITCIAALLTFYATAENEAPAVIAGFGVGTVFFALFAVCFYLIGRTERQRHGISTRSLCEDMDEVAIHAGRSDLAPEAPAPAAAVVKPRLLSRRKGQT